MAGKIFINYRRGDDPNAAGRLFDRLQDVFAPEQLFMDVDSIEPGLDFVRELNDQVGACDVLIAVIGQNWLDARDEHGARRLDNPHDFVRIEIEAALARDKRVIPVLVGQARMPSADQLPPPLQPLTRRNAVRLTHERFRSDLQALIAALQRSLQSAEASRAAVTTAASEQTDAAADWQYPEAQRRGVAAALAQPRRHAGRTIAVACSAAVLVLAVAAAVFFARPSLAPQPVLTSQPPQPSAPPAPAPLPELAVTPPDNPVFTGQEGGPFTPLALTVQLKAIGGALHWSLASAPQSWLTVSPDSGDIAADQGMQVVLLTLNSAAAQSLAPGRNISPVTLRNDTAKTIDQLNVVLMVMAPTTRNQVGHRFGHRPSSKR